MIYNKNNFSIASLAPGNARHYLDGIHITSGYTEVTNGHYAVRVSVPKGLTTRDIPNIPGHKMMSGEKEGQEIDFILPAAGALMIEKMIPKKNTMPILQNAWLGDNTDKDNIEFICTDLGTSSPSITRKLDAKFPNIDVVLPKDRPEMEIGFDPDYMIKLCQQFKKNNIRRVNLSLYGEKNAMKLEGTNIDTEQEIVALLMPKDK